MKDKLQVELFRLVKDGHSEGRWRAELEDGSTVLADINMIADYSLYEGRFLTEPELSELRCAEERLLAKERALKLLASRQMSRGELIDKLTQKGSSPEAAESAADIMERLGAIDDAEYAGAVVRSYARKGFGAGKIRSEFIRRKIPRELWDEALCQLGDSDEVLDRFIMSALGGGEHDRSEIKKLTDRLLRRGFKWEEIKRALARYDEALDVLEEIE